MYCYLCLEKESINNPFCDIKICNCKGTNRIHTICYSNLRFNKQNKCSICKSVFKQEVKRIVYESNDYKQLTTKIYKNDELEYLNSRVSTIACCIIE